MSEIKVVPLGKLEYMYGTATRTILRRGCIFRLCGPRTREALFIIQSHHCKATYMQLVLVFLSVVFMTQFSPH
jgi:hypothetical protein